MKIGLLARNLEAHNVKSIQKYFEKNNADVGLHNLKAVHLRCNFTL